MALFLASYHMTGSGAVHSPRDLSSARGRDSALTARGVRGDTPKRRINGRSTARGGAFFSRDNRLESHWRDAEHCDHFDRGRCSFSHAARHRRRRSGRGAQSDGSETYCGSRIFRGLRLFHVDLLRLVCLAHDRTQGGALSHCRAHRLYELFDRSQHWRHRVHGRRRSLPHLLSLRARRHRSRKDLLCRRPDVLARQRHGAGAWRHLPSAGGGADRSIAGLAQSRRRCSDIGGADILRRLGLERAEGNRPGRLESRVAERAFHLAADRHRDSRSRQLRARYVHAVAEPSGYRLRDDGGGLRVCDVARLREPRARWAWRVRCRHAGGALAIRQGRGAGWSSSVQVALLHHSVCACLGHSGVTRNLAERERYASPSRAGGDKIGDCTDPQRDRIGKNRRQLIMAINDERRSLSTPLVTRLRSASLALLGRPETPAGASIAPAAARVFAEPQALLIEQLIDGIPEAAIVLDREGRVIAFNEMAISIAPALRRGEPALIALRMPELVDAIRRAIRRHEPQRVEFFERVPLDRWFEAFVTPVTLTLGAGGTVDILMMTFNDLTPLRRVEEMRADSIANASHELRTPLAALLGFIETLQGPAKDDPVARDKFLGIMQGQATRMARLIDDLLSLSRIELNAHLQPNTPVDLAPIVRQVVDGLQMLARDRGVEIKVALPPDVLTVLGDRDELIRALENLIENALKYGAAGKRVDVTVAEAQTRAGSPEARVAVRDYGPGISPEHLPRLTERFYRVDVADSRARGGTGLGLALVKHVLNRHGGRLTIESTPGAGATFTMHVPLHTADSAQTAE